MLLQYTTGSVEDRMRDDVQVSVLNAGIQAANIVCTLRSYKKEGPINMVEQAAKIYPHEELIVLDETGLKDVHCEVVLTVDSPSLIVTILAETRNPLQCQTVLVDDIEAPIDGVSEADRSSIILWGYTSKGEPF